MRKQSSSLKPVLFAALSGVLALVGGCGSGAMYMTTLRNYPECVTQAQISRVKVDACMDSSDKTDFNACLVDKKVPQSKIDVLNSCVDAHRRSSIGNLFEAGSRGETSQFTTPWIYACSWTR